MLKINNIHKIKQTIIGIIDKRTFFIQDIEIEPNWYNFVIMTQKENANLPPEIKRWGIISLGRKPVIDQYPLVHAKQPNMKGGVITTLYKVVIITTLSKSEILPNTIVNQMERHISYLESPPF